MSIQLLKNKSTAQMFINLLTFVVKHVNSLVGQICQFTCLLGLLLNLNLWANKMARNKLFVCDSVAIEYNIRKKP